MPQRLPLIPNEMPQQFEFLWSEPDRIVFHRDHSLFEVNLQIVAQKSCGGIAWSTTPERGANARHQLLHSERLHHVIVCAGVERLHFVAFAISDGEHDYGHVAGSPNFSASIETGHSRHIHVEDDQDGPLCTKHFERLLSTGSFDNGITVRRKSGAHNAADLRLVVNDQNGAGVHECAARVLSARNVNEKTDPCARWLLRLIVPP